jgi:hypothetical protein
MLQKIISHTGMYVHMTHRGDAHVHFVQLEQLEQQRACFLRHAARRAQGHKAIKL